MSVMRVMRSALRTVALAIAAWLALAPAAGAEVQLSIRNGLVTIVAKDATVRQILAEWARVGKTHIVNAERIPGGPLSLELRNVPEAEALDVLLRTLSGYMAAPRIGNVAADASVYDSIVVMPTVAAAAARTAGPAGSPATFTPPPSFNQNNDDDQDSGVPTRPGGANAARPPIFSTFPSPQQGNNNPASARPTLPVLRPGVVAQPQQQTNNPNDGQAPPPVIIPAPVAPPASSPGQQSVPVGTSAPGMIAPAPTALGQIQRPNGE
jgi:hypothetical protein